MTTKSLIKNALFQDKLLTFLKELGMPLNYTSCEFLLGDMVKVTYDNGKAKTVLTIHYREETKDSE